MRYPPGRQPGSVGWHRRRARPVVLWRCGVLAARRLEEQALGGTSRCGKRQCGHLLQAATVLLALVTDAGSFRALGARRDLHPSPP